MLWDNEDTWFHVVVNAEGQYSLWPIVKEIPNGWRTVEFQGTKTDCLAYIEKNWSDMSPLSLRQSSQSTSRAIE